MRAAGAPEVSYKLGSPPERRRQRMHREGESRVSLHERHVAPSDDEPQIQSPTWHSAQVGRGTPPSPDGRCGPLGSTPANRGACVASNRILRPRIFLPGDRRRESSPAFAPAHGRARARGALPAAGASIGIDLEGEQDSHGVRNDASCRRDRRCRKRRIAPPMIDSKAVPSGWVATRLSRTERLVNIGTRLPGATF